MTKNNAKEFARMYTAQKMVMNTFVAFALLSATASAEPSIPDNSIARLESLALLNGLNADLLGHDSATLTLDRWCEAHHLAPGSKIVAELDNSAQKNVDADMRKLLRVAADDLVKYRRVKLSCGGHVLSEADNWYVPGRLTPEMNHILETTNTAFGRAVQALHFERHTLSAEVLWKPLPDGWEMRETLSPTSEDRLQVPRYVIQHKAFLTRSDGLPFSALVETYTNEVLDFPLPGPK
jgi:chorismate-pyruvate lyase